MNYTLSTNRIHISPAAGEFLSKRMNQLAKHIPQRLKSEPVHVSLKENLSKNYVEGTATLRLPGKTVVARSQAATIKQVIALLTDRLRKQVIEYKSTHDRWHSDFPDKSTIRRDISFYLEPTHELID